MSKPGHDIIVKVGLTADQYLHLVRMAEDDDITQSAFMRRLLLVRIRSAAQFALDQSADAMPIPAPDQSQQ
jgi:hypothetical protein